MEIGGVGGGRLGEDVLVRNEGTARRENKVCLSGRNFPAELGEFDRSVENGFIKANVLHAPISGRRFGFRPLRGRQMTPGDDDSGSTNAPPSSLYLTKYDFITRLHPCII